MKNLTTFFLKTSLVAIIALVLASTVEARKVRGGGHKSVNRSSQSNRNRNTNVNRNRNTNVNVNRNVNVNVNNNYHHGGCCYNNHHPVARVAAVTATAMIVGSIIYSLPPNCTTVIVNGFSYRQCGSTWYQPQISGSSTTYVVINQP